MQMSSFLQVFICHLQWIIIKVAFNWEQSNHAVVTDNVTIEQVHCYRTVNLYSKQEAKNTKLGQTGNWLLPDMLQVERCLPLH